MNIQAIRASNLAWLSARGFKVAPSLPVGRDAIEELRPVDEIARRLMALDVVFTWVSAPEAAAATAKIQAAVQRNDLERAMSPGEQAIYRQERSAAHEAHVDAIGWRLENMWALAWVLGFDPEPTLDGTMIEQDIIRSIIFELLPKLGEPVDVLIERASVRSLEDVVQLEDRFYCCHNAVRSAQLGGKTVPAGFHPIASGGVIHERRHALTWCLSPGTSWEDTDLST